VVQVFGYTLSNPIGISAGLDKDAEIPDPLFELGPAIVEVGGTTPLPQPGNPRKRVFRIPSQKALINRYGLNSKGADHMAAALKERVQDFAYAHGFGVGDDAEARVLNGEAGLPPGSLTEGKLLAVQVSKNKTTPDNDIGATTRDYVYCVDRLAKYADILVVNVSSPNTAGLRDLQKVGPLTAILKGVVEAAQRTDRKTKPYVMVKVSPDEDSDEQISGICDAVRESGVDGVIVANTTNRRPSAMPRGYVMSTQEQDTLKETGGFSGPHLFPRTLALVQKYRSELDRGATETAEPPSAESLPSTDTAVGPAPSSSTPKKVIFASGGISTGQDALDVLNAGASVAMLYTGLIYGGSGTITRIKEEMRERR
jgi:dihydroorotate dehydrogenase